MIPFIYPNQSRVDRLLIDFAQKEKPTIADFKKLEILGPLYDKLDQYRMEAKDMTRLQLRAESHKSDRLERNMARGGDPRPSNRCDCHAIVSGGHARALAIRGVLAWMQMRIDDPHNGCWLPRDWEDRQHMPNHLRNAVPHRRIHKKEYYEFLTRLINPTLIRTPEQLVQTLRMVRVMLQSGNVPPGVMPTTGRR